MSELKFGILHPQANSWSETVELACLVEELGFDSYWVADHWVNPANKQGDWFDGWSWLAGLAAQTNSIRLGTLVSNIIYRNPAVLAVKQLSPVVRDPGQLVPKVVNEPVWPRTRAGERRRNPVPSKSRM